MGKRSAVVILTLLVSSIANSSIQMCESFDLYAKKTLKKKKFRIDWRDPKSPIKVTEEHENIKLVPLDRDHDLILIDSDDQIELILEEEFILEELTQDIAEKYKMTEKDIPLLKDQLSKKIDFKTNGLIRSDGKITHLLNCESTNSDQ